MTAYFESDFEAFPDGWLSLSEPTIFSVYGKVGVAGGSRCFIGGTWESPNSGTLQIATVDVTNWSTTNRIPFEHDHRSLSMDVFLECPNPTSPQSFELFSTYAITAGKSLYQVAYQGDGTFISDLSVTCDVVNDTVAPYALVSVADQDGGAGAFVVSFGRWHRLTVDWDSPAGARSISLKDLTTNSDVFSLTRTADPTLTWAMANISVETFANWVSTPTRYDAVDLDYAFPGTPSTEQIELTGAPDILVNGPVPIYAGGEVISEILIRNRADLASTEPISGRITCTVQVELASTTWGVDDNIQVITNVWNSSTSTWDPLVGFDLRGYGPAGFGGPVNTTRYPGGERTPGADAGLFDFSIEWDREAMTSTVTGPYGAVQLTGTPLFQLVIHTSGNVNKLTGVAKLSLLSVRSDTVRTGSESTLVPAVRNVADNVLFAPSTLEPAGGLTWWDGAARQPAILKGWWDGDAVRPGTVKGWWDGSAVRPVL